MYRPERRSTYKVAVNILPGKRGLAERYYIHPYVQTPYVIFLDDDRSFNCNDIRDLAITAQAYPNMIVAPHARTLKKCPDTGTYRYADRIITYHDIHVSVKVNYVNVILPGHSLIPLDFLPMFKRYVPKQLIDFSIKTLFCDDIFFNWAVTQGRYIERNETGPIAILSTNLGMVKNETRIEKLENAIDNQNSRSGQRRKRSACYAILEEMYPDALPLAPFEYQVEVQIEEQ